MYALLRSDSPSNEVVKSRWSINSIWKSRIRRLEIWHRKLATYKDSKEDAQNLSKEL